jgi:hypothetical protein
MRDVEHETARNAGQEALDRAPETAAASEPEPAPAAEVEVDADEGAFTAGVLIPPGADVEQIMELVKRAYPDIVPEVLVGDSVDALLASVPAAREAYARVMASLREQAPAAVPSGSGRRPPLDVESLSPESKIRVGISRG